MSPWNSQPQLHTPIVQVLQTPGRAGLGSQVDNHAWSDPGQVLLPIQGHLKYTILTVSKCTTLCSLTGSLILRHFHHPTKKVQAQ
jgi:hypothetical protein